MREDSKEEGRTRKRLEEMEKEREKRGKNRGTNNSRVGKKGIKSVKFGEWFNQRAILNHVINYDTHV